MARTQRCPTCQTELPVHEGYVTWCHECGWNLSLPKEQKQRRRIDRLYERAGRRLGNRLVAELLSVERLEPRLTAGRLGAYAIAVLVYLLTAALFAGGVLFAMTQYPNPFAIALALLMVGTAVLMRPRLGRMPKEGVVERSGAPKLYALVDEISRALAIPQVDAIVVDREFNASWEVVGLRRRRVMTLGLPLLAVLEPQERVALIAHELAHARNGDATRGVLVGSAVSGLAALYWVVSPEEHGDTEGGPLLDLVAKALLFVVSRPVWLLLILQLHLVLRDMQRAEYLADALAARVAGTEAAVATQEKLLLEHTIWATIQHAAGPAAADSGDMLGDLAEAVLRVPERERERRRRLARLEDARLDVTHPPTGQRIEVLEGRSRLEPQVVLTAEEAAAIDVELATRRREQGRRLLEEYREAIYG